MKLRPAMVALAAALLSGAAAAACFNPWLRSEHVPDTYSLDELFKDRRFAGKSEDEFCKAFHDAFYDFRRHGFREGGWHGQMRLGLWFHHNTGPFEPAGVGGCFVFDPVKLINCYGFGYCMYASALLEGVYERKGLDARRWNLHGGKHSICEVFHGGKWHYLDIDLGGYAMDARGSVMGVHDIIGNVEGFVNAPRKSPYFFRADRNGAWARDGYFSDKDRYTFFDSYEWGHEMSICLRQGESLTRYFQLQGDDVPDEKNVPKRYVGSAVLVYSPNLTSKSSDLEDGAYSMEGVRKTRDGLRGPGEVVFAVRIPYPMCHSTVEMKSSGEVKLSCSQDLGRSWKEFSPGRAPVPAASYDYLLKVAPAAGALVKKLTVTTVSVLNPGTLPVLVAGANRITFSLKEEAETLTWTPDWSTRAALEKGAVAFQGGYKASKSWSINGAKLSNVSLTYSVEAPPGGRIHRLLAHAVFRRGSRRQRGQEGWIDLGKSMASLKQEFDNEDDFQNDCGAAHNNGHQTGHGEGVFDSPKVFVRYRTRNCGIWGARMNVHYRRKLSARPYTLLVTHCWDGNKRSVKRIRSAEIAPGKDITYTVTAPGLKENTFVRMEVPSQ